MRSWLVGGAVIETPAGLLLVANRRRNGSVDWTPPGGVIDVGETVLEGLAREVVEETGLVVTEWRGPIYHVAAEAVGLGWDLRVEVWQAVAWSGELAVGDDPDGIVTEARFVGVEACDDHLVGAHPWVAEPVGAWVREPWTEARQFRYAVDGADMATATVRRLP